MQAINRRNFLKGAGAAGAAGIVGAVVGGSAPVAALADEAAALADGTYTGTGTGMGGDISVTIEVKDGVISVVEIGPNKETVGIGGYEAIEDGTYASQIEAAQGADIDTVSGATITTAGVKAAVADALSKAQAAGGTTAGNQR